MKLLILTQYYPPETGAAQNRLHELAVRLQKMGVEVKVLTAMPNYPRMKVFEAYRRKCRFREEIEGITVFRSWIYVKTSKSLFHRLLNYFSFVLSSFLAGCFRTGKADYIMCESPPLFLGISAYLLSKVKRAGMIFNVSDLWPESAEKLGLIRSKFLLGMSTRLEECLYRKSVMICGQTQGIVRNISGRFPGKNVYWLPNGADLAYYDPGRKANWREKQGYAADIFIAFYGGILGHAQGLEVILKAANRSRDNDKIRFIIMGNGPLDESLKKMTKDMGLQNLDFFDTVSKVDMPDVLASIDVSVIPLKKLDLFLGAIPSKIFESLAMKKPILLGVEGEAKELFIDEGSCGLAFEPENDAELAEKVLFLAGRPEKCKELGENARKYANDKFNRDHIAEEFHQGIMKLYAGKK